MTLTRFQMNRTFSIFFAVGLMFAAVFPAPQALAQHQRVNWVHLDNVSLVDHPANDGDSFHARRNRSRYLLRVYFVDTPETDDRFPERLQEQADYFGVTVPQIVEGGKMADEYTKELLAKAPFDVYTKYRDARGASRQRRIFAMIKVEDRWLCELLVENGFARIHGVGDDLPDNVSERRHWARLRTLENEAKREKRGIWGMNTPEQVLARAGGKVTLKRQTPIFSIEPPFGVVGQLPEGHEVKVGDVERPGFRRVEFVTPGGTEFTGLIQEVALQ